MLLLRHASGADALELDPRTPSAQLGWQVGFITCTVGGTSQI